MIVPVLCMANYGAVKKWSALASTIGLSGGSDTRGIAFNPATGNVILGEDDGNDLAILDADTGTSIGAIINADTGDGTVDPFKVACSSDGYIYTFGFAASVKLVGTEATSDASGSPVLFQAGSSGSCRSGYVTGSHTAGTATVVLDRGGTCYVYQNSGGAPGTYTQQTSFATGFGIECQSTFITSDLTEIYVFKQGTAVKKFTGDGTPSNGYTEQSFSTNWRQTWRYDFQIYEAEGIGVGASGHNTPPPYSYFTMYELASGAGVGAGLWTEDGEFNNGAGACCIDQATGNVYACGAGVAYGFHILNENLKINELQWDDYSGDDKEFIEIYGPAGFDLTGWTIDGITGSTGAVYDTANLSGTIPSDGFYVVSPFADCPNLDLQDMTSIQNGEPDALVLKDAEGYVVDAFGYEFYSAGAGALPAWSYEGDGMFGRVSNSGWDSNYWAVSRATDGYDTDNNDRDFVILPATPGVTNADPKGLLPTYQNNFNDAADTNYGDEWWGCFVDMTAKAPGGSGLPAASSPEGGNFGVAADTSGGGNMVCFMDKATTDVSIDCYVYLRDDLPTSADDIEEWKIALRGKVDAYAYNTNYNGATGLMWKFVCDDEASTLSLVERLGGVDTVHTEIPIYGSSYTGWQRLRLDCLGSTVMGVLGGNIGETAGDVKYIGAISNGFTVGGIGMGYREYLVDDAECLWLSVDAVNIKTEVGDVVPVELSVFKLE